MTTKNPTTTELAASVDKLTKLVDHLLRRVAALEQENKRLRGNVSRAAQQLGVVASQVRSSK